MVMPHWTCTLLSWLAELCTVVNHCCVRFLICQSSRILRFCAVPYSTSLLSFLTKVYPFCNVPGSWYVRAHEFYVFVPCLIYLHCCHASPKTTPVVMSQVLNMSELMNFTFLCHALFNFMVVSHASPKSTLVVMSHCILHCNTSVNFTSPFCLTELISSLLLTELYIVITWAVHRHVSLNFTLLPRITKL